MGSAAALNIIKAHHPLENILTKMAIVLKDQLSTWYGNWPMKAMLIRLCAILKNFRRHANNSKRQSIYHPATVWLTITGVQSRHDPMNSQFGSCGEMNKDDGDDVKGFAKIFQPNIYLS